MCRMYYSKLHVAADCTIHQRADTATDDYQDFLTEEDARRELEKWNACYPCFRYVLLGFGMMHLEEIREV